MNHDIIKKEIVIQAGIEQVWQAISDGEEISKWFLKADFKAKEGYEYTFKSDEENCEAIIGKVLLARPYTLKYTWKVKSNPIETTVFWLLEKLDSGTKLILTHSGISNYKNANVIDMYNNFDGGWNNCINKLSCFVNN